MPSNASNGSSKLQPETYKIVAINNVPTLVKADFDTEANYNYNYNYNEPFESTRRNAPTSNLLNRDFSVDFQQKLASQNYDKNELAYDIADPLGIKEAQYDENAKMYASKHMDVNDVCVARVNSAGAKLALDCGVTLLIPEGAISPAEQQVTIYLGLCRDESFKPKLNERNTSLSEIVTIGGPHGLTLLKPVILAMEHSAKAIGHDWNVNLYSAFNSSECAPDWNVMTMNFFFFY